MTEKCDVATYCPLFKVYTHLSSSEAGKHLLNAKREVLLALKTFLEKEIEKTEQAGRSKKAQKVKIG